MVGLGWLTQPLSLLLPRGALSRESEASLSNVPRDSHNIVDKYHVIV